MTGPKRTAPKRQPRPASARRHARGGLAALAAAAALGPIGCATNTQTGMLVGGAGGAGVGAAIGSASGHAGAGALIGGTVGLIGGGLIGNSMDQADAQRQSEERAATASPPPPPGYAVVAEPANPVTIDQVVVWANDGTRDEVIIDRIQRGPTVFHLSAADEAFLRDQRVNEEIIQAMRDTANR